MNTDYPIETRTLIEKMLQLGTITDANISNRFLMFYQDSTLQSLIADVEA
ncbi:lipoprotein, GldB family, partial [human gut metagenome]